MEKAAAKHIKMAETEFKFIEFLNMSQCCNTFCVIRDLQH